MSNYKVGDRVQIITGDMGVNERQSYFDRLEELNRGSKFGLHSRSALSPIPYDMAFATVIAIPTITLLRNTMMWIGFDEDSAYDKHELMFDLKYITRAFHSYSVEQLLTHWHPNVRTEARKRFALMSGVANEQVSSR